MKTNIDAIVAGAGIWGCTVARRLAEAGKRVLVLEKRKAVGGNCRCRTIDGIEVHLYGSHIFHTSNEEVWKFVNRFATFNDYRHVVLANHKNKLYHLPIGCTLLKEFFGRDLKPSELTAADRDAIFDAFIRGYTSKQWGVPPEKVDPSIIARLKVRENSSTDYFDDPHQGIPLEGYNELFRRMLDHPNITVQCGCELRMEENEELRIRNEELRVGNEELRIRNEEWRNNISLRVVGDGEDWINEILTSAIPNSSFPVPTSIYYSGPIDALFNYKYGALPWRTLRFERETLPVADYQGNAVVNYTDADVPFTRIHEFRHYHPESDGVLTSTVPNSSFQVPTSRQTIIMREYSATWKPGDEPYYPISTPESAALLARYQAEVEKFNHSTIPNSSFPVPNFSLVLGGRLGQYHYYDMDKSIAAALEVEI